MDLGVVTWKAAVLFGVEVRVWHSRIGLTPMPKFKTL